MALQPESGQAADGTERLTPTSEPPEQASAVSETSSDQEDESSNGLRVGPVDGLNGLDDQPGFRERFTIVPLPGEVGGYLGTPQFSFGSGSGTPQVVQSLTGQRWISVETTIVDDREFEGDVQFTDMHVSGSEIGILESVFDPDRRVDLLTSEDGAVWHRDNLPTLKTDDQLDFASLVDGELAFISVRRDLAQQILLRSGIEVPFTDVCFANPGPQFLSLLSCDGESFETEREDVQDPQAFDQASDCLGYIFRVDLFGTFAFELFNSDVISGPFTSRRPLISNPVRLDSRRWIALAGAVPPAPVACSIIGDLLPEPAGEGLAVWDRSGEPTLVQADLVEGQGEPLFPFQLDVKAVDDTVFALTPDDLIALQLDGTSTSVVALEGPGSQFTGIPAALMAHEGGVVLTQLVDGVLIQDRVDTGGSVRRTESQVATGEIGFGAVEFHYIDDEMAIFTDRRGALQRIELPTPE